MAVTNKQKAQVLQDQAALNLFTTPRADPAEVAEYLRLRRQEELTKLKERLDDIAKKSRVDAAEVARVAAENAAEVVEAMRQRVPPPPLSRSPSPVLTDSRVEDDGDVPLPPPETRCTPSPSMQFRTPEPNQGHEEDVVGTQQSVVVGNFTNWRSFRNHQVGDESMADGGEGRFRVFF
jgi:hypothetical protein